MRRVLPLMSLVIVTNVAILASARANRTGDPDAVMTLTERELHFDATSDRDSTVRLELQLPNSTRFPYWSEQQEIAWLTPEKLAALGLTCGRPAEGTVTGKSTCGLGRRAFVAYEYDGPAWKRVAASLQRRRESELRRVSATIPYSATSAESIGLQITNGSRLVPVDVSLDAASLRRAYPDRQRYLVVPAVVQAELTSVRQTNARVMIGTLDPLTPTLIAPARWRDRLLKSGPWIMAKQPGYTVTVAVGRRHEPWILAIDAIDSGAVPH